jgi:hypothetical protein
MTGRAELFGLPNQRREKRQPVALSTNNCKVRVTPDAARGLLELKPLPERNASQLGAVVAPGSALRSGWSRTHACVDFGETLELHVRVMNLTRMAALLGLALTTSGAHEPKFTTPYAPGPLVLPTDAPAGYQPTDACTGYQPRVKVGAATRIDWTFCVSTRSLAQAPESWLPADYDSRKQVYELIRAVGLRPPADLCGRAIHFSGHGAGGLGRWQPICKEQRIIFASPYG